MLFKSQQAYRHVRNQLNQNSKRLPLLLKQKQPSNKNNRKKGQGTCPNQKSQTEKRGNDEHAKLHSSPKNRLKRNITSDELMKYKASTPDDYVAQLPEDRKEPIEKLRKVIVNNLPEGFEEGIQYGMIGYYVPHSIYPKGYHCAPELPLPFIHIASQKSAISVYHIGIYADEKLYDWFVSEYPKHAKRKLDMGKSCIRFKKIEDIPYQLIGELCTKLSVEQWIEMYEMSLRK